jgi:hypothetical protein
LSGTRTNPIPNHVGNQNGLNSSVGGEFKCIATGIESHIHTRLDVPDEDLVAVIFVNLHNAILIENGKLSAAESETQ